MILLCGAQQCLCKKVGTNLQLQYFARFSTMNFGSLLYLAGNLSFIEHIRRPLLFLNVCFSLTVADNERRTDSGWISGLRQTQVKELQLWGIFHFP